MSSRHESQNQSHDKFSPSSVSTPSLEEAIEILDLFTAQHVNGVVPTLEGFELQNGSFEVRKRSTLEKTLSLLVGIVSQKVRKEQRGKLKPIKGKLLHSVDTIKIALMKLKNGHLLDHELKERMLCVVHRYNAIVGGAKKSPASLSEKIKYFFFKRADWVIDDEMLQSEIHIPQNVFYHASANKVRDSKTGLQHKFSYHISDPTSEKIASSICISNSQEEAQRQELELFCLKAQALLRKEVLPHTYVDGSLHDAMQSLRSSPIETTLSANSILSLRQTISPFPGEEVELCGAFSRSRGISIPIKDMFQISSQSLQTGFPHPLQYTGFAFSEKLLPRYLLRSYLAPGVELILKKKRKIAEELLPTGALNAKAKALLHLRKKIWKAHREEFGKLQKKQLHTLFQSAKEKITPIDELFELVEKNDSPTLTLFEKFSQLNHAVVERFITHPIYALEQLWAEPDNLKTEGWEKIYAAEVEKVKNELLFRRENCTTPQEKIELSYKLALGGIVGINSCAILQLIFSEEHQSKPCTLDAFQKKMLASTFYQATTFHYELEQLDIADKEIEKKLYRSIVASFEQEIELFSRPGSPKTVLVEELENYYNLRHNQ